MRINGSCNFQNFDDNDITLRAGYMGGISKSVSMTERTFEMKELVIYL